MDFSILPRRLILPLVGGVMCVCSYLAMIRPATASVSTASGFDALWAGLPDASIAPLLLSLRLDPGSPERWSDLAEAMQTAGRDADARYCVEQSLALAPKLPHVALRAAGMYFRLGEPFEALRATKRIAGLDREYDLSIFRLWQRFGGSTDQVFTLGVGDNARVGRDYFRFLVEQRDSGATERAWSALQARKMTGEAETFAYARALTAAHDYDGAAAVESPAIENGGFESAWRKESPDWHIDEIRGMKVSRDSVAAGNGGYSLRVDFDGSNRNDYSGVSQTRALAPGTWKLSGRIRLELRGAHIEKGLGATPGFGLMAFDGDDGRLLAETELINVTSDWVPIQTRLNVGPHARLVRISIARPSVPQVGLAMTGSVWFDEVALTREDSR